MFNNKPILAIETSQNLCSICVYYSDSKLFEMNFKLKNAHAEKLFESIEHVMNSAGIGIVDVGAISVSAGPGSFTGLRIGMSAAKGLAFGASIPIIPVPTFEALSLQVSNYLPDNVEFIIANKVNVEEVYFAKFKKNGNGYEYIEDLQVLKRNEIDIRTEDILIFGNALLDSGNSLNQKSRYRNISSPDAEYIAKWSILFGKQKVLYDYEYLEPTYIKNFIVKERKNV
ncbi:MAG: tRNA (adenosine(37)-N6)-threonylcarbamoyltransferase complex dimerization subunit type 1 TsaB [Ignavibacteriaceae bacterium]